MNRQIYRLVFNRARGALMAVAETACAQRKSASGERSATGVASLAVLLGLAGAATSAQGQIVADPQAPGSQRPTVLAAPNGVPLVNIQTPSSAGVSRNTYSQFNVNTPGAILNNSRGDVQTQLGGWVQGNPWLSTGSARVILNEVNSSNPSFLNGWVEVAGQRAEVVIANPAGIQVNGSGFINASGVTLTTGTPVFNGGALESYRVQGGQISFNGNGLDARSADYTAIFARAVQVNAGIWANKLQVVTGQNTVSAATLTPTSAPDAAGQPDAGAAPTFALDVSELGGMYAGQIHLIGTEAGLGVNQRGVIAASAGNLVLQASGQLSNSGVISGSDVHIEATALLNTAGANIRGDQLGVAVQSLDNAGGSIAAGQTLDINAQQISNRSDGQIYSDGELNVGGAPGGTAGAQQLSNSGVINGAGVHIEAASLRNTGGGGIYGDQIDLATQNLGNESGSVIGARQTLSIGAQQISNGSNGQIHSDGELDISGTLDGTASVQQLANGGVISGADVRIETAILLNTDGGDIHGDQINLATQNLSNESNSVIAANQTLNIGAQQISNGSGGQISSDGELSITGALDGAADAQQLANSGVINGENVHIEAASLLNTGGGNIYGDQIDLAGQSLNNESSSVIAANQTLNIGVQQISNGSGGEISSGGDLSITGAPDGTAGAQQLVNSGLINGMGVVHIEVATLRNTDGGRIYGDTIGIATQSLSNGDGSVIAARETLDIGVQQLSNRGSGLIYSDEDLRIGGTLDAQGHAQGMAQSVSNDGATIESQGDMRIATAAFSNTNANLVWQVVVDPSTSVTEYFTTGGTVTSDQVGWITGRRVLLKSDQYDYDDPAYKKYYEGPEPYVAGYVIAGYNSDEVVPPTFNYEPTDPIWAKLGMTPPTAPAPTGARPSLLYQDDWQQQPTPESLQAQQAWDAQAAPWLELNERVQAMRSNIDNLLLSYSTYRQYTQTTQHAEVTTSAPGRIVSGGNLSLITSANALNQDSQIIAGGDVDISGVRLQNLATEVSAPTSRSGTVYSWATIREDCNIINGCEKKKGWKGADYTETIDHTVPLGALRYAPNSGSGVASSGGVGAGSSTGSGNNGGSSAGSGNTGLILPALPNLSGSLFQSAPPGSSYLIETDPAFANHQQWLGSDYMLSALSADPATLQKRLGDGLYEQRLVREQIIEETGQRYLGDYASDEAQYQALMDAGVTFAKEQQLAPGVALSAEQIAALTSDIVWLVQQEVMLPDGSTTLALVPQVYVMPRDDDLTSDGKFLGGIVGKDVDIALSGDLLNSGSIAGRQLVSISADGIQNQGGSISAAAMGLNAKQDIDNIGGTLAAQNVLVMNAGGDINIVSATASGEGHAQAGKRGSADYGGQYVDRVAAVYVGQQDGVLVASAGKDLNITGALLASAGNMYLDAGNNLNLQTVQTSSQSDVAWNSRNSADIAESQEVGSQIMAAGNITMTAGNAINSRAGQVQADGDLTARAKNITIEAGTSSLSVQTASHASGSGLMSSGSTTSMTSYSETSAVASQWGGGTVDLNANQDIAVRGSEVIADGDLSLSAGKNLSIEAVQTTSSQYSYERSTQSGLSTGNMVITLGSQGQSVDQRGQQTHAAGSTVGALNGNVTMTAGAAYTQTGSDVWTPHGDISVDAQSIAITEARETSESRVVQRSEQSGLSLGVQSALISTVQGLTGTASAMSNTSSDRMKALGAATLALQGYNQVTDTHSLLNNPAQAASATFSLSIGSGSSVSETQSNADMARGSTLTSGGNVSLNAHGAGANSDILIQGSDIDAKKGKVSLDAEGDISLLAAQNHVEQDSNNSSHNGSVGIGYQAGTKGTGFGIMASFGMSQGQGDGEQTTWSNTHIDGKNIELHSGGDTTLRGAVVSADQVKADVGGDLTIESLQDTATYDEDDMNAGASVFVGYGMSSGSFSYGQTTINSNYASVTEQTGIRAGDGGFQVNVQGHTDLIGGAITSTDAAVESGVNRFETASLSMSDIRNVAEYSAQSIGVSGGTSMNMGSYALNSSSAMGMGEAGDTDRSMTRSGISGFAGNKDARTGDKESGIENNFDVNEVTSELNAQVAITQNFGQQASKAVGDYAQTEMERAKALEDEAANESDPQRRAELQEQARQIENDWGPEGRLRILAHTVIGGLTGGLDGALGAAVGTMTAPQVAQALQNAGITGPLADMIVAAASTAAGAAAGGTNGAMTSYNEVVNNYLSHDELEQNAEEAAACNGDADCLDNVKRQATDDSLAANSVVQDACQDGPSPNCSAAVAQAQQDRIEIQAYRDELVAQLANTTDPEDRSALQKQIAAANGSLLSVNSVIGDAKLLQNGGNIELADLTPDERMAIGFALGTIEGAGVKAGQQVINEINAARASAQQVAPENVTSGQGNTSSSPGPDLAPPPDTYPVYPRGEGAATGPLPPGYTAVSRWVSPEEATLWMQNQGTAIPTAVPRNGTPQLYVTEAGAPYPPGANGTIRIDFAVPDEMLRTGNSTNNFIILQPSSSTPIYNVNIHIPNGTTLPKVK